MTKAFIRIIDINKTLISHLKDEFKHSTVNIIEGDIFDYNADAIVSPANSFGYMDGGLDGKLKTFFGLPIETKVRQKINADHNGELLVGQTAVVETDNEAFPFLIVAPTMRVPSDVSESINAYLAMRAVLFTAIENKMISTIIIPGLCSLSGRMAPHTVARQMRAAYDYAILGSYRFSHWRFEKEFEAYLKSKLDQTPIE